MSTDLGVSAEDEASALAERVARGDQAAENLIVGKYAGRVLAMAIVRTRDREASRELADDVLMATITALRRGAVRDTARLGAFIHGTAVNLINNFLRARGRHPPPEELPEDLPLPDTTDVLERDCDRTLLQRSFAHLEPGDRMVLSLTLVDGLDPEDIAQRLGLSGDTVRQRKSRALKRLRQALAGESHSGSGGPHN